MFFVYKAVEVYIKMNKEEPVDQIKLDNKQIIEIYDASRKIAEDTWLVALIFRMTIIIEKNMFKENISISDYNKIKEKLGNSIIYEVRNERNFIYDHMKDNIMKEIIDSFLNTKLKYLSHLDFPEKFVLKKFNEK